jgi:hypothetical protein
MVTSSKRIATSCERSGYLFEGIASSRKGSRDRSKWIGISSRRSGLR